MIKVIEFFRRRQGMPKDAFIKHWQQRHTQVVLGIKGLRRYVQNPVIPVEGLPPADFDGVVEVWFDDFETMRANGRSDYWPVVVEDEKRFIDRDSRALVLADDPGPETLVPGWKLLAPVKKAPGLDLAGFRDLLPAVLASCESLSGVRESVCDLPILSSYQRSRPVFADAVVALRFDDLPNLQAAVANGVCTSLAGEFAGEFASDSAVGPWLAVEERLIRG